MKYKVLFTTLLCATSLYGESFGPAQIAKWNLATTKTTMTSEQMSNMVPAYATAYVHDGVSPLNIAQAGTYYSITNFTAGVYSNCVVSTTGITVNVAGTYSINSFVSFTGQSGATYEGGIFVNGLHQDTGEWNRKIGTGADIGSASGGTILNLASNSFVQLKVTGDTTGGFTNKQTVLSVSRVGSTMSAYHITMASGGTNQSISMIAYSNTTPYFYTLYIDPTNNAIRLIKSIF